MSIVRNRGVYTLNPIEKLKKLSKSIDKPHYQSLRLNLLCNESIQFKSNLYSEDLQKDLSKYIEEKAKMLVTVKYLCYNINKNLLMVVVLSLLG